MTIVIPIGKAPPCSRSPMRECVTFKCRHCGSERVVKDAYVEWDKVTQAWVVKSVFETSECLDCDTETKLVGEVIS